MNVFNLKDEVKNEILTAFIIKIASGQSSLEECKEWFATNII